MVVTRRVSEDFRGSSLTPKTEFLELFLVLFELQRRLTKKSSANYFWIVRDHRGGRLNKSVREIYFLLKYAFLRPISFRIDYLLTDRLKRRGSTDTTFVVFLTKLEIHEGLSN